MDTISFLHIPPWALPKVSKEEFLDDDVVGEGAAWRRAKDKRKAKGSTK